MILETIKQPADLRRLSYAELDELAGEIRDFIVAGGRRDRRPPRLQPRRGRAHARAAPGVRLAPRRHPLGHRPPGLRPQDRHRPRRPASSSCARRAACRATRAGPSPSTTGSRTATPRRSSRYAYGLAVARDSGADADRRHIVAVIGDGSMTGGMAYEALNNLGHCGRSVIIVLNDNGRSYAPTVSKLSREPDPDPPQPVYMRRQRRARERSCASVPLVGRQAEQGHGGRQGRDPRVLSQPPAFFEALGVRYIGPVDGHDIEALEQALRNAAEFDGPDRRPRAHPEGPRLPAGRGRRREAPPRRAGVRPGGRAAEVRCRPATRRRSPRRCIKEAEHRPDARGHHRGHARPDRPAARSRSASPTASSTSASPSSTPSPRAAGMAMGGLRPVVAIYSTFLNRACDQVVYDVGLHRPAGRVLPRPRRHHRRRRAVAPRRARHGAAHQGAGHDGVRAVVGPGAAADAPRRARALRRAGR